MRIDPWSSALIEDYEKALRDFGIGKFSDLVDRIEDPHRLMRRGVIFGHRDFERILRAIERGERFAVVSGMMPSGKMHLGHKMVVDQIIWYQERGAEIYIPIADLEAYAARGIPLEKAMEIAIDEYVLNYIALGLKPDNCQIYFQSKRDHVKDLAMLLGRRVNLSEMTAIYGFSGEHNLSHVFVPLIQVADILHPQLEEFGGPKPVVVPVGIDQDPHIRLTRDLAWRFRKLRVEREGGKIKVTLAGDSEEDLLDDLRDRAESELGLSLDRDEGKLVLEDPRESIYYDLDALASKVEFERGFFGFIAPSSTYHRFMTGLTGEKMSSSKPQSAIFLNEDPEIAREKIWRAKTGGRESAELQRKLGGIPEDCMVYELLLYHLIEDDEDLARIYGECRSGERLCGDCKRLAIDLMTEFLKDLRERREQARDLVPEYISR